MKKRLLSTGFVLAAVGVFAACAPGKASAPAGNAVVPASQALLEQLSHELEMVRDAAVEDIHYSVDNEINVAALVTLTKDKIRAELGEPRLCEREDGSFCAEVGDWFYSFYHLPYATAGGGAELILRFGHGDICAEAFWVGTQ